MSTDEYFVLNGVFGVGTHLSLAHLVQRILLIFWLLVFGLMQRGTVVTLAFEMKMSIAFLINENL